MLDDAPELDVLVIPIGGGGLIAGNAVAAGTYSFRAVTGGSDPSAVDADLLDVRASARVDSVTIEPTGLSLNLAGLGGVPLSAIHRIG